MTQSELHRKRPSPFAGRGRLSRGKGQFRGETWRRGIPKGRHRNEAGKPTQGCEKGRGVLNWDLMKGGGGAKRLESVG